MNTDQTHEESGLSAPGKKRPSPRRIRFRTRFFLGIGAILFFFNSIGALLIYRQGTKFFENAAYEKSQIAMALVEATQRYVRELVRPKMYDLLGGDAFVLEAMSTSYASRMVMDYFRQDMPEYLYRRVAIDARNPESEANAGEVEMIRYFEAHPRRADWKGMITKGSESFFVSCRPVRFDNSCLHCHGDSNDAPRALLAKYGTRRGFGRKNGEVAGIMAVGVPADMALSQIRKTAVTVFIGGFSFSAVLFVFIVFLFNRVVVNDLRGLLDLLRSGLRKDEADFLLRESVEEDEVAALGSAAGTIAIHLATSRKQLEENAEQLEKTVAERTGELQKSEQRLREQVAARNLELKTLNTIAELTTMANCLGDAFPRLLDATLKVISAGGAGLYLVQPDCRALELIYHRNAPEMAERVDLDVSPEDEFFSPPDVLDTQETSLREAAGGHAGFFADAGARKGINVPLCCRGRVLGVISFRDVAIHEITQEFGELISSVGRQIGIAMESLQTTGELLRSKELLQSVFDGITDMVVLLDAEFRIKMVNKAYLIKYGLKEQEVLGRLCREFHAEDTCRFPECGMRRSLDSKSPLVEEVKSKTGEIFLVHFYPVIDDYDSVLSVVRYVRDITGQKRIERHIQETERLSSLGQLSAGIAHEINNPLGVILTYTALLQRQLGELPQAMCDVATIEKHALNCKRIVSDLLKFARNQPSEMRRTSVNETIEDTAKMLSHQLLRKNIEIQMDLSDGLPLLHIDSEKMKQVFVNLILNSMQAIAQKGVIRIATAYMAESRQVKIVFQDNGAGILPEVLPKVFDPFFTTKPVGEGTGLGLSVSYGIVKDHRGEVFVSNEPGGWTQFTILLPAGEVL